MSEGSTSKVGADCKAARLGSLPAVLFVFGLAGAGKSFVGSVLERHFGYFWHEADNDLTQPMRDAIRNGIEFTEEMRDEFFARLCDRIRTLSKQHPRLVVTQAAYKQRHREWLLQLPHLQLLWVDAPTTTIIARLEKAKGAGVTCEYAEMIRRHFEPPGEGTLRILNDVEGEVQIVAQIEQIFGIRAHSVVLGGECHNSRSAASESASSSAKARS